MHPYCRATDSLQIALIVIVEVRVIGNHPFIESRLDLLYFVGADREPTASALPSPFRCSNRSRDSPRRPRVLR